MCQVLRYQRDEVTAEWRKSHNVVPCNLCCSHYIFSVMKSRSVRMIVYVLHVRKGKDTYRSLVGHEEDLGIDRNFDVKFDFGM